jgi:uncharacterized repeat protein (TIGR02543 family)
MLISLFPVSAFASSEDVASLTHNGAVSNYGTLQEAFQNADNGDTITLLQSVTTTDYIGVIHKDITFDLGGYSATIGTLSMDVNDLTIQNGTLTANSLDSTGGTATDTGLLFLQNATVTVDGLSWMTGEGIQLKESTLTIQGAWVQAGSKVYIEDYDSYIYCVGSYSIRATEDGLTQTAQYLPEGYACGDPYNDPPVDSYILDEDGNLAENFYMRLRRNEDDTPATVKIAYDLNDGTGADGIDYDSETVNSGTTITVKAEPTREGYSFTGWLTGDDTYQSGDTLEITEDITFVAQWTRKLVTTEPISGPDTATYKVKHYKEQLDGSYVLAETESSLYDAVGATVTATAKEYEHYHVNEDASTLSGTVVDSTPDGDDEVILTLKVYYDLNTVAVSYDLNGGTGADGVDYNTVSVKYGTTVILNTAPTREGYTFTEWTAGDESYAAGKTVTATEDITFVAGWKEGTSATTTSKTDSNSPQTGDNISLLLWFALLIISGAGLVYTSVYRKKRRA